MARARSTPMTRTGWPRSPIDQRTDAAPFRGRAHRYGRVRAAERVIRLSVVQPQPTEGPGTPTPPNRRPRPDSTARPDIPSPRDRRPPSFQLAWGRATAPPAAARPAHSTTRSGPLSLDRASRCLTIPCAKPLRALCIPSPVRLIGGTADQGRPARRQRRRTLNAHPLPPGMGKPATPSALPLPGVQPASADVAVIEPTSNTCSIITTPHPAVTPESRRFGGRHTVGVTSFKRGGQARSANNQGLWRSW